MTARTPVERGAHSMWLRDNTDSEGDLPNREWEPDERQDYLERASAVFESIDRDGLAHLIEESFREWWEDTVLGSFDAHLADAIIAYLLGEQS